jgi:hypothetical protein
MSLPFSLQKSKRKIICLCVIWSNMRGTARVPLILYFGTRQGLAVSTLPGRSVFGKGATLGGPLESSIRFRTDKNLIYLLRMSQWFLGSPFHNVTIHVRSSLHRSKVNYKAGSFLSYGITLFCICLFPKHKHDAVCILVTGVQILLFASTY